MYNLSKSLIHAFDKVDLNESCGLAFQKQYLLKEPEFDIEPTPDSALGKGQYFEYLVTGQKPRSGEEPQAAILKSGKLNKDYQRIQFAAEKCKENLQNYLKVENLKTGRKLEHRFKDKNVKGILDIECHLFKKYSIIDLKLSGLIGNKWEDFGWSEERIKDYNTLQARMYKWLAWKVEGIANIPFYYLVYSSKNQDAINWKMDYNTDEDFFEDMKSLEKKFDFVIESIKTRQEITGWQATDNYLECLKCPAKCEKRKYYPNIKTINL